MRTIDISYAGRTVRLANLLEYEKFYRKLSSGRWETATFQTLARNLDRDTVCVDIGAWIGYAASPGTPKEITTKLAAEIAKAVQVPEVRERMLGLGLEPTSMTPDEMAVFMRKEQQRYGDTIITRANDDTQPTGRVFDQSPEPNTELAKGDPVDLSISLGQQQTTSSAMDNIETVLSDNSNAALSKIIYSQTSGQGIAMQPMDQSACLGAMATFSVTAYSATAWQWYHGMVLIPGANGPTLTINPVTLSDAGPYHVVVMDSCGVPTTSNDATLFILPDPVAPTTAVPPEPEPPPEPASTTAIEPPPLEGTDSGAKIDDPPPVVEEKPEIKTKYGGPRPQKKYGAPPKPPDDMGL